MDAEIRSVHAASRTRVKGGATATSPMTTEGLFTTRKLQALLDSKINPDICKRADLAKEIARIEDHRLTVHAVDAWFKRHDANLPMLKRPSLDPKHDSFGVPGVHWATLFTIFAIDVDDLAPNDADFRAWCFRIARSRAAAQRRNSVPHSTRTLGRLFLCGAPSMREAMQADAALVRELGFHVTNAPIEPNEVEWSALRGLDECDALLAIVGGGVDGVGAASYPESLHFARANNIPIIIANTDAQQRIDPPFADCTILLRRESGLGEYQRALKQSLLEVGVHGKRSKPKIGSTWPDVRLISDRPSIAVLPFANLTGDMANDLLSDSIVEDLVGMLSRVPEFFVISRMSTQSYKHAVPDPRIVARDLGVRYALIGSIRSSGAVVRITAQLVNALQGTPVWSGRFDRVFDDPFAVQDELVFEICAALEPQVRLDDIRDASRGGNVQSWRLWQEGWYYLFVDAPTPLPQRSLDLFQQAIELDPHYARAHAGMAVALGTGMLWGGLTPANITKAIHHAEVAYKLLPENPLSLYAMGMISFIQPVSMETTLDYMSRAVALEPSNAMYQAICGYVRASLGDTQAGVTQCEFAMRLSPKDSREPFLCYMLGTAYVCNRQYDNAIQTMTRCRRFSVVDFIWIMIAFSHSQLGEPDRAIACLQSIVTPRPYRLYEWSVYERLWTTTPREEKSRFLTLFKAAGIV